MAWDRVNAAHDKEEIVSGFVKCRTKGGMIVDVFGIEAFLPGSQIDVKPIRDYDQYVNKTMEFISKNRKKRSSVNWKKDKYWKVLLKTLLLTVSLLILVE